MYGEKLRSYKENMMPPQSNTFGWYQYIFSKFHIGRTFFSGVALIVRTFLWFYKYLKENLQISNSFFIKGTIHLCQREIEIVLKFITCLRILLFLNNRSIVHLLRMGEGHKVGHFLWTSWMYNSRFTQFLSC